MVFNYLDSFDLGLKRLKTTQNSDSLNPWISVDIKAPQMTSSIWGRGFWSFRDCWKFRPKSDLIGDL